jgi:hypothetical protein
VRNTVPVINGTSIVSSVSVGLNPTFLPYNPSDSYVYVTVDGFAGFNGNVSIIRVTIDLADIIYGATVHSIGRFSEGEIEVLVAKTEGFVEL